jgi:hypothetical protein
MSDAATDNSIHNQTVMRLLIALCAILLSIPLQSNAQPDSVVRFLELLESKVSIFDDAYTRRDAESYQKPLAEVLVQYKALSDKDQRISSSAVANIYYNLCCIYSLVNQKDLALSTLKMSIDHGYTGYAHIQQDTDLDNIRNEAEFAVIMERIRKVGDVMTILKGASSYNNADDRSIPRFTYQSMNDPNLVALRKGLNLDSIAGNGPDVVKIINLLRWIHNLIPHNGLGGIPEVRNAMSMINTCKSEGRGLNCRGLSIVLNECYLALGIRSRIVTCLPKDSLKTDPDCHVINMVYAESLKKWVWIDATHNAYVMNERGEMLSIEEVRDRLIQGKPLILNADANWNNENMTRKESYLESYMAKNLYMFECPVASQYNMETPLEGTSIEYVRLLPLEFYDQTPQREVVTDSELKRTWVTYKTNNPRLFWD